GGRGPRVAPRPAQRGGAAWGRGGRGRGFGSQGPRGWGRGRGFGAHGNRWGHRHQGGRRPHFGHRGPGRHGHGGRGDGVNQRGWRGPFDRSGRGHGFRGRGGRGHHFGFSRWDGRDSFPGRAGFGPPRQHRIHR